MSSSPAFKPLPTDYSRQAISCKFCGNYIYIMYAELSNGNRRYVPVNEGNPNTLHSCIRSKK